MNVDEFVGDLWFVFEFFFMDGFLVMDDEVGYCGVVVVCVVGIIYCQFDYWVCIEFVELIVCGVNGFGLQCFYGFCDIFVLKFVKSLFDIGIFLQQICIVVDELCCVGICDFVGMIFMSDGVFVYFCILNDEVIDFVSCGQGVFGIVVGKVLCEVELMFVVFDVFVFDFVDEFFVCCVKCFV